MSGRITAVAFGVLALFAPVAAHAQLVSTGASQSGGRDLRWDVSTNGGSSWAQAFVVSGVPGQWSAGAPGGTWIGATSSGTGGGGSYRIRSLFTLAVGDVFSFQFRCAADNGPVSFLINGVAQSGNPCSQLWTWGSFVNVGSSNFVAGQNRVEFTWNGDNTTDGIAVEIAGATLTPGTPGNPNVVPEPASVVLMATGLAGLGVVARRRRRV